MENVDPVAAAHSLLVSLTNGAALTEAEAQDLFGLLLQGSLTPAQIGAALAVIQHRGPTVDELTGAARVMRRHVAAVPVRELAPGEVLIDTCGTGGAPKTFNISTAAAFVAAAVTAEVRAGTTAGTGMSELPHTNRRVLVAKHGNRSRTGRGSAEVLMALGVNVDASPEAQARCLREAGVCFCFAIHHHPAMRHAAAPRRELGFPTLFNALGPMTNPAGADRQLIGVYHRGLVPLMAASLARLGAVRAMVVHGSDGLDEITLDGPTYIAEVCDGEVHESVIDPGELGLQRVPAEQIRVADVAGSVGVIRGVLAGEPGPARDIVLLNAAAALVVAGVAEDLHTGLALAAEAVDRGAAMRVLDRLAAASASS